MTDDVSPPSVTQMTTSPFRTPWSSSCSRPMSCKSSNPSRELMSARSAPVISPVRRSSMSSGRRSFSFAQILPEVLTFFQKGRQNVLSICLARRPVAPQP